MSKIYNWKFYDFEEIIYDDTKNGTKIKKEHYLNEGLYPVIDQGKSQIAGYVNESKGLYENVPAIIFGDHTRIVKYVDTPFFLGADGVKLLKCKIDGIDYKYIYYFLLNCKIPDTGYNRHYKWLKKLKIPIPPIKIQKEIVRTLDTVTELLALQKQQLHELDNLLKSIFYDMFGDPVVNEKGWETKKLSELGELNRGVSKHRPRNDPALLGGIYPLIQTGDVANSDLIIRSYKQTYSELGLKQSKMWKAGTLCITIAANIAKTAILGFDACFPDSVVGFNANEKTNNIFIHSWFTFFQKIIEEQAPESAQKNINLKTLYNLNVIVPPVELQNHYADIIYKLDEQKSQVRKAIEETQTLFDSLMSQYFDE